MSPNLLILAGTTEAAALARSVVQAGLSGTVSFAGRVERLPPQPLPQRVGGFGGVEGLAAYLRAHRVTHVIDATHPFAARMSANAIAACAQTGVPLVALTRAPWAPVPGDRWIRVCDIAGAVAALERPAARVMLAVGRMHLAEFAPNPQHFYLLRLVEAPKEAFPFPDHHVVVDRGPFSAQADRCLMEGHDISLVVSKNSGGTGAYAKIAAARALGLPVIMIDRPAQAPRAEVESVEAVLDWVAHAGTALGV
ncbi:cobalt-precorrin-6A reductase [Xanthobacter agilis]|uniref:Precorrin-6A/cobalt-precorrin-6A reductase n=1 Tax=Xanthobacter agilis TaxID=47492 RepID=A0ABU0LJ50_XANAG|nr:cobalt-precorrin-6A reductase [Xanthobacter agilis]MDQ0507159.1 precorrin-6A/cobalt-precorrin-6A reductase [Xanthobacter agilis]